ncbi:hypothetical protein QQF64_009366, partial [Cirrhinus molitorella]
PYRGFRSKIPVLPVELKTRKIFQVGVTIALNKANKPSPLCLSLSPSCFKLTFALTRILLCATVHARTTEHLPIEQ